MHASTMTPHDYANLRFLLDSDPTTLAQWYETVSEDDLKYAFALLTIARLELIDHDVEMLGELAEAASVIETVKARAK